MPKGIYKNNRLNIVGQTFERWNVIKFSHMDIKHRSMFLCKCNCGTERIVAGASLVNNISKSCGCLKRDTDKNKMLHNYTGERIGRLTVLEQTEPLSTSWGKKMRRWKVKCDCGTERIIQTQTLRMHKKSGFGSCGCWRKERNRQKRLKHLRPYEFYLNRLKNSTNNRNKKGKGKNNPIKMNINYDDLIKLIPSEGTGFCHYCEKPIFWDKYEEPKSLIGRKCGHNFDRKDNSKGYEINNIIFSCGDCNRTRGDRFTYEEFILISPILKTIRKNREQST